MHVFFFVSFNKCTRNVIEQENAKVNKKKVEKFHMKGVITPT